MIRGRICIGQVFKWNGRAFVVAGRIEPRPGGGMFFLHWD